MSIPLIENVEDFIVISSSSSKFIAFRIILEMPDLFIMNFNEGYLLPFQSIHIPITVKHSDGENVEYIKTDISIELAETENRHTSESVHQFWNSFHGLTSRRTIPCNIAFGQSK